MISWNHKHDQGFGNLHVLSYSGFLRHVASYLTHTHTADIERYSDSDGASYRPTRRAVSSQRRDVLEKLCGVLIKSNTENGCILKR